MNDRSKLSSRETWEDSTSTISSPESEAGAIPCGLPDGQTTGQDWLVERSAGRQANVEIAGNLRDEAAHERLHEIQVEMAVNPACAARE